MDKLNRWPNGMGFKALYLCDGGATGVDLDRSNIAIVIVVVVEAAGRLNRLLLFAFLSGIDRSI